MISLPFQEPAKQALARRRIRGTWYLLIGQEFFKPDSFGTHIVRHKPFFGCFEALPPGNRRYDTRFLPFRMSRWLLELVDLRKERVHKPRNLLVAVRFLWPIEGHQQLDCRNCVNPLAGR